MNLKTLIATILIIPGAALAQTAPGQPPPKPALSVAQCLSLLVAYRNLDGHTVIIKQNGQETPVMQPWGFENGQLRMKISSAISALSLFEQSLEQSRQMIIKEQIAKMPTDKDGKAPTLIVPGTPEFESYTKQYGDALNGACDVHLPRIKASELKLDRNEIPGTALAALAPVLDDDVSGK